MGATKQLLLHAGNLATNRERACVPLTHESEISSNFPDQGKRSELATSGPPIAVLSDLRSVVCRYISARSYLDGCKVVPGLFPYSHVGYIPVTCDPTTLQTHPNAG